MTSDQKRRDWKKNWNYGMLPGEVRKYRFKRACRKLKTLPKRTTLPEFFNGSRQQPTPNHP